MDELAKKIFTAAHAVHTQIGPGLFEIVYESCLFAELKGYDLFVERQKKLPLKFRNIALDCCYRLDLVVEEKVIIEVKAVQQIIPIHLAQMQTYLKLSGLQEGWLINFNTVTLKYGMKHFVKMGASYEEDKK